MCVFCVMFGTTLVYMRYAGHVPNMACFTPCVGQMGSSWKSETHSRTQNQVQDLAWDWRRAMVSKWLRTTATEPNTRCVSLRTLGDHSFTILSVAQNMMRKKGWNFLNLPACACVCACVSKGKKWCAVVVMLLCRCSSHVICTTWQRASASGVLNQWP